MSSKPISSITRASPDRCKVWIDLDNSPHVPSSCHNRGIKEERLPGDNHRRDAYQVRELVDFHHLDCKVIGGIMGRTNC